MIHGSVATHESLFSTRNSRITFKMVLAFLRDLSSGHNIFSKFLLEASSERELKSWKKK